MEYTDLWLYLSTVKKPIFLYGMGNGADRILYRLEQLGMRARGVFASDDFVRHQDFHGYTVCSYEEAKAACPEMLVLIAFGSSLPDVMANMRRIAAEQETYAPALPLFGEDFFTPTYAAAHREELFRVYSLLADESSRKTFREMIAYKITGKLQHLLACETPQQQVFETFFALQPGEICADLGAYNGDTILQFARLCPHYRRIYGMEPDFRTFRKLLVNTAHLERTSLWNACCDARPQFVSFSAKGGRNSAVGHGRMLPAYPLASLLDGAPVSYIKLDVEGQEANALLGAQKSIAKYKPKLSVSAYHRSEDLFSLPLLVHSIRPDYQIFLRHHPYIPEWDTNYYFT